MMSKHFMEIKKVEPTIGTDIKEAIQEAIDYAAKNDCIIELNFNECKLKICEFDKTSDLIEKYHNFLEEQTKRAVEFSEYTKYPAWIVLDNNMNIIKIQGIKLLKPLKAGEIVKVKDILEYPRGLHLLNDQRMPKYNEISAFFYSSETAIVVDPGRNSIHSYFSLPIDAYIKFESIDHIYREDIKDYDIIYKFIDKKIVRKYNQQIILKCNKQHEKYFVLRKYSLFVENHLYLELELYLNKWFFFTKVPILPGKVFSKLVNLLNNLGWKQYYPEIYYRR